LPDYLTYEEEQALKYIRSRRLWLQISIVACMVIAFAMFAGLAHMGRLKLDRIVINNIALMLGIVFILACVGILAIKIWLGAHLPKKDTTHFVRASIEPPLLSGAATPDSISAIFRRLAELLIHVPPYVVRQKLELEGWPPDRARYFVAFVLFIFLYQEWKNITTEGYKTFLIELGNQGWKRELISYATGPVIAVIQESRGRRTRAAIASNIAENIFFIVLCIIGWWQLGHRKFIVLVLLCMFGIFWNLVSIFRKLRNPKVIPYDEHDE